MDENIQTENANLTVKHPRALDTFSIGEKGTVKEIACECHELRSKLLSMGIIEGAHVEVTQIAPFGDPIKINILGFALALRLVEAAAIHMFSS